MALSKTQKTIACLLGTGTALPSSYGIYMLASSSSQNSKKVVPISKKKYGEKTFAGKWLKQIESFDIPEDEKIREGVMLLDPERNKEKWDQMYKYFQDNEIFSSDSRMSEFISSIKTSFDSEKRSDSLNGKCHEWFLSEDKANQYEIRDVWAHYLCSPKNL